ncbi:MAG: hypothetical protein R2873_04870 [Caldilineaceae bacterium]
MLAGTLHYAVIMLVCTILFFNAGDNGNPAALYILGALAGGDGLADIIGRRFGGGRRFGLSGAEKTVAGSVAMFAGSAILIAALCAVFGTGLNLVTIVILSLIAAVVEAFTPRGLDNYSIALSVFVGILVLSAVAPGLWPHMPLFTL